MISSLTRILLTTSLCLVPTVALAQVTPDGSTSSTVQTNGNVSTINGGEQAGSNLFHSFGNFSVPNSNEAYFNNSAEINNIFSRVTGGNVSNIDGLIRANNANLFLINPAGVIFGGGARLELGGSFYGTTADSILFPDGVEFSASNVNAPVLTINAPIGLNLRDNPTDITVQGANLTVLRGKDLSLVGGEINIDGATLNALGGKVNLTALSSSGTVNINTDLELDASNLAFADISLSNGATVNVNGNSGGEIAVKAHNLTLSEASSLTAGINADTATSETQAGNIIINASDTVTLEAGSTIRNNLSPVSSGNAGDIQITAKNLSIADGSRLSTISLGTGNTGNINLDLDDNITLVGTGEIKTQIASNAVGDSGDIDINANSLTLAASSIFTNIVGQGNAGDINIKTSDRLILDSSNLQTKVDPGATGNAGNINLTTNSLLLKNDIQGDLSQVLANTEGRGNAGNIIVNATGDISLEDSSFFLTSVKSGAEGNGGNIEITTTNLSLTGQSSNSPASLLADSQGIGNAGNITVNATGNISLNQYGLIISQVTEGQGNGGDVSINADGLFLSTGSYIISNTGDIISPISNNEGDAGDINLNSRLITLDNFSEITSNSLSSAVGKAGNVNVDADNLTIAGGSNINALTENSSDGGKIDINAQNIELITGGKIVTGTNAGGNAGNITLNVSDEIKIDGENAPTPNEELRFREVTLQNLEQNTGLFANTINGSSGNGGNIQITFPKTISILNGGEITVDSQGTGNGGNLFIQADSLSLDNQSQLLAETEVGQAQQQPSNINLIITDLLSLQGDSKISAQAFNNANGGNISINADFVVAFSGVVEGNDIIAKAGEGSGGRINITAQQIFGLEERAAELGNISNDLDVTSEFGFDGNLSLNIPDLNPTAAIRDLSVQAIAPEENIQQVCSVNDNNRSSSLVFKGKGGIATQPIEPMSSDKLLLPQQFSQTNQSAPTTKTEQDPPIITAQGAIYPAKGLIITDTGEVILTRSSQSKTPNFINQTTGCLTN